MLCLNASFSVEELKSYLPLKVVVALKRPKYTSLENSFQIIAGTNDTNLLSQPGAGGW